MTNIDIKLHYLQSSILRKLILQPTLRFNDLLIEGLESEHMNYHLQKLVQFELVKKEKGLYQLTDRGKVYSDMLDDDIAKVEKQPKTGVLIRGVRKNKKGEIEHLLSKRLKQPYYGMVGRLGGKVRFGETLQQAAERELFEETGLQAKFFQLEEIYRKIRHREDGSYVQDVLFYIFFVKDFLGKFIKKTSVQENLWVTKREFEERNDLPGYDDLVLNDRYEPMDLKIEENTDVAAQDF